MALMVQKYGGTSMADTSCIKQVAERIVKTKKNGFDVVVVVSAQAGVTDLLIEKAKAISDKPCPRELDMILCTGEQISIGLLSMALQEMGYEAISYTSAQIGLKTDGLYTKAKIKGIETQKIEQALNQGKIVILPGFQGVTDALEITTLGRGGSDTSAVAIAVALKADALEIYTDVDGVYTADPRVVQNAKKMQRIDFDEMLEMAGSGAKVLHLRSVELAAKHHLPIHLRSTFDEAEGTLVKEVDDMEEAVVRGVAHSIDNGKITLAGIPSDSDTFVTLFEAIANANIIVDVITQSESTEQGKVVTFTVSNTEYEMALDIARQIAKAKKVKSVKGDRGVARVSVIGVGMKSSPGVASKVFRALSDENIDIQMVTTSNINISCLIDQSHYHRAVNAIHKAFEL